MTKQTCRNCVFLMRPADHSDIGKCWIKANRGWKKFFKMWNIKTVKTGNLCRFKLSRWQSRTPDMSEGE